ncbi:MAG: hypothetical protein U9N14_01825 [Pseudomonadota bacterium]|nr:hypothetical protein [Pseudomonadota bacterium]
MTDRTAFHPILAGIMVWGLMSGIAHAQDVDTSKPFDAYVPVDTIGAGLSKEDLTGEIQDKIMRQVTPQLTRLRNDIPRNVRNEVRNVVNPIEQRLNDIESQISDGGVGTSSSLGPMNMEQIREMFRMFMEEGQMPVQIPGIDETSPAIRSTTGQLAPTVLGTITGFELLDIPEKTLVDKIREKRNPADQSVQSATSVPVGCVNGRMMYRDTEGHPFLVSGQVAWDNDKRVHIYGLCSLPKKAVADTTSR